MLQRLHPWNTRFRSWLWWVVIVGILAALPVVYDRVQTENTSKKVETVFDYRHLLDVAALQPNPEAFVQEWLGKLKEAGVESMAMYESTLSEFKSSRRILLYNANDVSLLTGQPVSLNENYTYLLFTNKANETALSPIIRNTFTSLGYTVNYWTHNGMDGLKIETSPDDALMKPMPQDPITMQMLHDRGFQIVPRLTDALPYNQQATEETLAKFHDLGVKRIIFEGESVKGYNDNAETGSLTDFANRLTKYDIGIATIENLKKPQKGIEKLSYLIDYNVVRLYSLSEKDSSLSPATISDRFALATKDRNIRMLYLNTQANKDVTKAQLTNTLPNLVNSLQKPGNALKAIEDNGFTLGQAEPFQVHHSSLQHYLKLVVVLGAVAFIALLISYFIPVLISPAFIIGLIGAAGLYKLKPALLEQGLALGVAISAPTIAMILVIRKTQQLRESHGDLSGSKRIMSTLIQYVKTAIISFMAVPFMIALLNNITYSLVLNQFRGVSLLHLAPIGLIALYVFLYCGESVMKELRRWLSMPITVIMVVGVAIAGAAGYYYLTRTGNEGQVSSIEMVFRSTLENVIGVRPRFKEFMLAHPLFLVGMFVGLRYAWGRFLFIIAVMGQLSMVDTFAHIHSPIIISSIRGLLGLGLGLVIGLIAILVWQIVERCWKKWSPLLVE
ncbi:hypothetical protein BVG16_20350 [Paenibacillus selenitireducens]|uniref:Uncharacterized protein n=1 Tax=Paenibacillus selenitireducens TaxID=1324314 RepID=A0A1T2X7M3_9BACL|nr:DUF5693 family protein [Paenibacillus selenitireducens]OPA75686.1 hypothetical protein BVG16_20350 [Paenibacillus selenitireducens]